VELVQNDSANGTGGTDECNAIKHEWSGDGETKWGGKRVFSRQRFITSRIAFESRSIRDRFAIDSRSIRDRTERKFPAAVFVPPVWSFQTQTQRETAPGKLKKLVS
jgi:hypothetical protein